MLNQVAPSQEPLKGLASAFASADVAYANLEIPLTNAKTATPYKSAADIRAGNQFILKADPGHITGIKASGFDLLSTANNHGMDYGWKGLSQMIGLLNQAGIQHSGGGKDIAAAEQVAVYRLPSGYRVGLIAALAFVGSGGLNACGPAKANSAGIAVFRFEGQMGPFARAEIRRRVSEARRKCDFLIVAPHWGIEKQTKPRDWQLTLGRALIDAGADAVIGSHPHVLQGKELYRGKPILYSTGNLVSPRPASTAVYFLKFEGAKLKEWSFRPVKISGGRATFVSGKEETAARRRIEGLDALIPKAR
jgi:poly-gamma-glutamate capsule biosynthesis protein CapA/YwtB (metallophosphatase superfamily)